MTTTPTPTTTLPRVHVMHVPGVDPGRDAIVAELRATNGVDACVHEDPQRRGCVATWLAAMRCAASFDSDTSMWSVVINDDLDLLPGWTEHLALAVRHSPHPVLSLVHLGSYGAKALAKGAPYGQGQNLTWGGAMAYRRDIIRPLTRWAGRTQSATGFPHDDVLVSAYLMRTGQLSAMCARSIFGLTPARSLLGHSTSNRGPSTTIAHPAQGPAYDHEPRAVNVHRTVWPEIRELASRA